MFIMLQTYTFSLIFIVIVHSVNCMVIENDPPAPWQTALMARYIIHKSDWVAIATISTLKTIEGYPFVNLKSMSDGPLLNGTGIPYLYMTKMDLSGKDISVDNRCSIMASLAESDYCKSEDFDPQDPRCARILLSGHLIKVENTTDEFKFAQNALYTRHPAMKYWPADHDFYVAKIDIEQVAVLDYFGGVKYVTIEDYFNANTTRIFDIPFDEVMVVEVIV